MTDKEHKAVSYDWDDVIGGHDSLSAEEYRAYLQTPHWQKVRARRMQIDKYVCAFCGASDLLQVHHISYERLGHEEVRTDLVTLCADCHHRLHQLIDDEKPYVDSLYRDWLIESNAAMKAIAEKYLDKQIEHLVRSATPFVVNNGWRRKPTIVRVVEDALQYNAGRRIEHWWYNTGCKSLFTEAMKRLPKAEKNRR